MAPPLPISLPRAPFLVLMVSLVVVGVVGVLVLNTKINENAFRLDALRGQQAALDLQEQQLRQNLTELESPGNLRRRREPARPGAGRHAGLHPPARRAGGRRAAARHRAAQQRRDRGPVTPCRATRSAGRGTTSARASDPGRRPAQSDHRGPRVPPPRAYGRRPGRRAARAGRRGWLARPTAGPPVAAAGPAATGGDRSRRHRARAAPRRRPAPVRNGRPSRTGTSAQDAPGTRAARRDPDGRRCGPHQRRRLPRRAGSDQGRAAAAGRPDPAAARRRSPWSWSCSSSSAGRLVQFQFADGAAYAAAGLSLRLQPVDLPAPRGSILDRNRRRARRQRRGPLRLRRPGAGQGPGGGRDGALAGARRPALRPAAEAAPAQLRRRHGGPVRVPGPRGEGRHRRRRQRAEDRRRRACAATRPGWCPATTWPPT